MGDEGVRAIYQFITKTSNSSVEVLEFMNGKITELGCEFISRCFMPDLPSNILVLNLDYNPFGNSGLYNLVKLNPPLKLEELSLSYCDIDAEGINMLEEYLMNEGCQLVTFNLQGNPLKNEGLINLCKILMGNESLKLINLNNTSIGESKESYEALYNLLVTKKNIIAYYLKYNMFTSDELSPIASELIKKAKKKKEVDPEPEKVPEVMEDLPKMDHIKLFEIDEKLEEELFKNFYKANQMMKS